MNEPIFEHLIWWYEHSTVRVALFLSIFCGTFTSIGHDVEAAEVRGRVLINGQPSEGAPRVALWLMGPKVEQPKSAELEEVWVSFNPKVQIVPPGSILRVRNDDEETHTVHLRLDGNPLTNVASVPGAPTREVHLDHPGVVLVTCDLHQSMKAFIVVEDSLFTAVSDLRGEFHFSNVPPGRYPVRAFGPGTKTRGDDGQLGTEIGIAKVGAADLTLSLQAPPVVDVASYIPPTDDTPAPRERARFKPLFQIRDGWPHGPWILVMGLALAAMLIGIFAAVGNFRMAQKRGWSKGIAILFGCAIAFLAGTTVLLGLHGAIAIALGFGAFLGTMIFGAADRL